MKTSIEQSPYIINGICGWWESYNKGTLDYLLVVPYLSGVITGLLEAGNIKAIEEVEFLIAILRVGRWRA